MFHGCPENKELRVRVPYTHIYLNPTFFVFPFLLIIYKAIGWISSIISKSTHKICSHIEIFILRIKKIIEKCPWPIVALKTCYWRAPRRIEVRLDVRVRVFDSDPLHSFFSRYVVDIVTPQAHTHLTFKYFSLYIYGQILYIVRAQTFLRI